MGSEPSKENGPDDKATRSSSVGGDQVTAQERGSRPPEREHYSHGETNTVSIYATSRVECISESAKVDLDNARPDITLEPNQNATARVPADCQGGSPQDTSVNVDRFVTRTDLSSTQRSSPVADGPLTPMDVAAEKGGIASNLEPKVKSHDTKASSSKQNKPTASVPLVQRHNEIVQLSDAAVAFLRECSENPHGFFPKNNAQFTAAFINAKGPVLARWVRQQKQKHSKMRQTLQKMLVSLKCLETKKGNVLRWDFTEIKKSILATDRRLSTATTRVSIPNPSSGSMTDTMIPAIIEDEIMLIETMQQLKCLENQPPFQKRLNLHSLEDPAGLDIESNAHEPARDECTQGVEPLYHRPESALCHYLKDQVIVAVDCEGVPANLYLIQVGTQKTTYIFDCVKLGPRTVCEFLSAMLKDPNTVKLFHDLHKDASAITHIGGVPVEDICGTFDTQLAVELLTGHFHMGFNEMLGYFGLQPHATKHSIKQRMEGGELFAQRPLPHGVLNYAADDVKLLITAVDSLLRKLEVESWHAVQRASDQRARMACESGGERQICFDVANSYKMASYELLNESRPGNMLVPTPITISNETSTLIDMLPHDLSADLLGLTDSLSDIVLDKGRTPIAWVAGKRILLGGDGRMVESSEIESIVERLGGFGSDNRAGLERQLHRISAFRNRESEIIGLTMRVGRHVSGNANMIADLLFADPTASILFLGEPGSGKTTVVREVTRLLAERCNVCIVDTSNEIAGDGDVPHPCVGFARRMMVPSLDKQSAVMIECVQNHTPEVMVIDEIGRPTEVEAARTCKNRGVRLIASAHGDLRKLIKNPKLRGLVGGVESVTLGDVQARIEAKKRNYEGGVSKMKTERAGPPTFDVIVELRRGEHNTWRIVKNTADAVDRVLDGKEYLAQRRTRNPATGTVQLDFERA